MNEYVVKVRFLDAQRLRPIGREYTYLGTADMQRGDIVVATSARGESKALVTEVGVSYEEIRPWVEAGTAKSVSLLTEEDA